MVSLAEWLPDTVIGITFTMFGLLKLYGVIRCIEGGRNKPLGQYVCGYCPSWKSPWMRWGFPLLFLAIGLWNLGCLALALTGQRV